MFFVVTGGSGSGKSAFAEKLTASLGEGRRIYIATMMCFDEEGKKRISRHRAMRADKHFETLERYTDLCGLEVPEDSILLLECMSNLVANEMFDESGAKEGTVEAVVEGLHHLHLSLIHIWCGSPDWYQGRYRESGAFSAGRRGRGNTGCRP